MKEAIGVVDVLCGGCHHVGDVRRCGALSIQHSPRTMNGRPGNDRAGWGGTGAIVIIITIGDGGEWAVEVGGGLWWGKKCVMGGGIISSMVGLVIVRWCKTPMSPHIALPNEMMTGGL